MTKRSLSLGAAAAATLGGVLFAAYDVITFFLPITPGEFPPSWIGAFALLFIALVFILLGLIGLYSIQIEESGWLGLIGFLLAFLGIVMFTGFAWGGVVIVPEVVGSAPQVQTGFETSVSLFVFGLTNQLPGLGFLIFGLASFRASVLSRGASALLTLGSLLAGLSTFGFLNLLPFGEIVLGSLGFAWLGISLWQTVRGADQATPA